jgi:hypothetical protein
MNIPPMRTGFSNVVESEEVDDEYIAKADKLLLALLVKAFESAAFYAKHANRTVVTPKDLKISLMYEAHEFWNHEDIEETIEDIENDEAFSDDEEIELEEDDTVQFTFAESEDPKIQIMNEYYNTWDTWNPTDATVIALKNAINQRFID